MLDTILLEQFEVDMLYLLNRSLTLLHMMLSEVCNILDVILVQLVQYNNNTNYLLDYMFFFCG